MTPTMPKKPPKPADLGGTSDGHKYPLISVRPRAWVYHAVKEMADQEDRSESKMAAILLEEALRARGRTPPPKEGQS
jgi:hypothetical protein